MPVSSPLSLLPEFPEISIQQCVFPLFREHGENVALIDAISDKKFTFTQTLDIIERVASGLNKIGVKKGDVVALFSPNSPEWVFMYFATLVNGATVTTVNPAYTVYELTHNLNDSCTSVVFTIDALRKTVFEAAKNCQNVKKIIVLGKSGGCGCGCTSFEKLVADDKLAYPDDVQINPKEDVAVIPYSSGTTGVPKGVMITHYNIVSQLLQYRHPDLQDPRAAELGPPVVIAFLPFFHVYGMVAVMLGALCRGGTVVTLPRFVPEQFLSACEKYKVTYLPLVPPVIVLLNSSDLMGKYDLSRVQRVGSGAAPLAKDTEEEFAAKLGVGQLGQGYGMTEMTCAGSTQLPNAVPKRGSSGIPLPNTEIMILDVDTRKELGPNQPGELCYRGPNVMKGYFNRPEATANTIDKDGWLYTGDIAYYDEDGYLFVVDRLKELIKYKGFQVAPAELEGLLLNHPKVADVAVIGVPDKEAGELPRAYVVKAHQAHVTEEEIKQYVSERLSSFKHLKGGVEFVVSVPKSPSGKILRRQLRDKLKNSKL